MVGKWENCNHNYGFYNYYNLYVNFKLHLHKQIEKKKEEMIFVMDKVFIVQKLIDVE